MGTPRVKSNFYRNVKAIHIVVAIIVAALIIALAIVTRKPDMAKQATSVNQTGVVRPVPVPATKAPVKTPALTRSSKPRRVATPEALDRGYYVDGKKTLNEKLSYAQNEELLENF